MNDGHGSDLSFANLSPGQLRVGEQYLSADMSGVGSASLALTVSGATAGTVTDLTSLTISFSDPEPTDGIRWSSDTCRPSNGYTHHVSYPSLAALSSSRTTALGSLDGTDDGLCVRFEVGLSSAAGNDVRGAAATFALDYTLEQTSASRS